MMLPGTTISPPNFLTPRRRPPESRPLRDEPPAFLWAIVGVSLLSGGDAGDLQHGERLAMAVLAAVVVPAALLEDQNLVAELVLDHLGGDRRARNHGGADGRGGAFATHQQHLVEGDGGAGFRGHGLDDDDVVLGNSVLFAAGADHCVHGRKRLAGSVVSVAWKLERTGKLPSEEAGTIAATPLKSTISTVRRVAGTAFPGVVSAAFRKGGGACQPRPEWTPERGPSGRSGRARKTV